MHYSTFNRSCKVIQKRLASIQNQLSDLTNIETLSDQQECLVRQLLQESKDKLAEFNTKLDKFMEQEPPPNDFDEDGVSMLSEDISNACLEIVCFIESNWSELSHSKPSEETNISNQSNNNVPMVKLPKLSLPKFNGNSYNWITFYNLFQVTVHENSSLSNVEKFQYLLAQLEGEALSEIKSLAITNANYIIAWNKLVTRYHNVRLLISLHINKILDMPNMTNFSVKTLRSFISTFNEQVEALLALDTDVTSESPILVTLLLRKFDGELRKRFEMSRNNGSTNMPTIKEFVTFLEEECAHIEAANLVNSQASIAKGHPDPSKSKSTNKYSQSNKPQQILLASSENEESNHINKLMCSFCKSTSHNIYQCDQFKSIQVSERFTFAKSKHLCMNCLRDSHHTSKCNSTHSCTHCHKKHHSLLHLSKPKEPTSEIKTLSQTSQSSLTNQTENVNTQVSSKDNASTSLTVCSSNQPDDTILLGTTLVHVSSPNGNYVVLRAILDSAAQATFITQSAAQLLGIKRTYISNSNVFGLSSTQINVRGQSRLNISNLNQTETFKNHTVIILDKITSDLPRARVSPEVKTKMNNVILSDPTFDIPSPIHMLLGADIFAKCLKGEILHLGNNMPIAINTSFGFVLVGSSPIMHNSQSNELTTLLSTNDFDLHESLQRFWALDDPPCLKKTSQADDVCEKHFQETVSRDLNGRYIVKLPFKSSPDSLGNSSEIAKSRFKSVEKKLESNIELKQKYVNFMNEYISLGHMEEVNTLIPESEPHYYLPHHGVIKDGKIRVVFDASCRTSNNISLNQILHSGPKLHNDIVDILYNFRRFPIVFTCDIRQMFRQILIHPDHQQFQLIFWRSDQSQPLKTYKLLTVTYGMTSSPFHANRTIQQLLIDEGGKHKLASEALMNQIFVDDIILGADSEEEALLLKTDIIDLMKEGRFELRKWSSNNANLLESIPDDHKQAPLSLASLDQPLFNVLGIKWLPDTDEFTYILSLPSQENPTKRLILSCISKIFDPCGWLTPITLWAKCFVQQLWTLGVSWDENLPENISRQWIEFCNDLPMIQAIKLPRFLHLSTTCEIQLIGFSDASEKGYAAVLYLRTVDIQGHVHVTLLAAKSRVAPLKRISIPRLELSGALLLSKLLNHYISLFSPHYNLNEISAWCDSTIVLSWIQTPPHTLKVFVGNRVAEIQELIPSHLWYHVSSHENPADCASRGMFPSSLIAHPLWQNGPEWLLEPPEIWPKQKILVKPNEDLPEMNPKTVNTLHSTEISEHEMLTKYSSWTKLQRITAYVLRFIHNIRHSNKITGSLTHSELIQSKLKICAIVQSFHFKEDLLRLNKNQSCSTRLQRLMPFVDSQGILRVGGRLQRSSLTDSSKHPILLPKKDHVTNLLIDCFHEKYLHAGPQLLQSILSKEFWILSARSLIRSRINKCIKCFRSKPKFSTPLMSDLPASRVSPSRPFTVCGTDYAGPFMIKIHKLKRTQPVKVYWCLFICFSTKAVHIEIVTDLTADGYIAALVRFTSRRGLPTDIYSDQGKNYVGGASQIRNIMRDFLKKETTRRSLQHFADQNSISFHFNPPCAPNFGGLWERAIQSAKYHVKRVIGEQILTLEEFTTLSTQIEAMLNSRPLSPLSNHPSELNVLTPGHFLIGSSLTSVPEQRHEQPMNRLKRWHMVQSFSQHIWKRWKDEYLQQLQPRNKWTKHQDNIKIGDIVIIHEDNSTPLSWKMGKVSSCLPGKDGIIRVVELITEKGKLTRPVSKVARLPIDS